MRVSDSVANYILQLLQQENGVAEIQRNELAGALGCVPSQINYVLTSRFSQEQGYLVESRRGGGGYIRITRLQITGPDMIMHLINTIGEELDEATARTMLDNLTQSGALEERDRRLIYAGIAETTLNGLPREMRNACRARIFKGMLAASKR